MKIKLIASILCATLFLTCLSCGTVSGTGESVESPKESEKESAVESVIESEKEPEIEIEVDKSEYIFVMDGNQTPTEILAKVYFGEEEIISPELSFATENPDVCTVENGVVTPIGVGRTEVSITYEDTVKKVAVMVCEKTTEELVNTFDETQVNLYGRTYIKDDKLYLDHVCTGVGVAFKGEELSVTVDSLGSTFLCVFIDGEQDYSSRIRLTQGLKTYKVAEGLESGFHTVRLVKSNEIDDGQIKIVGFSASEFYTAPEKSPLYIEFIGDSITTGYGALGSRAMGRTVENSDGCSSFAYKTATLLGADYSIVAKQGICVKAHVWLDHSMSEIYGYVSTRTKEKYSFDKKPDIVVLNLGTNDSSFVSGITANAAEFSEDYYVFLSMLRVKYPDAYIMCLYGFMGKDDYVSEAISTAVAKMQDARISDRCGYYAPNNDGANDHPTKEAQAVWATSLTRYINEYVL